VLAGLLAWQNFQQTELTMKPQIPHEIIDEEPVLVCPDCKVPLEEDWLGNDRDPENWAGRFSLPEMLPRVRPGYRQHGRG